MERDELARMLEEGLSLETIGLRTAKHPSTVGYWIKRHGLEPANGDRHRARGGIDPETLAELVARNLTVREIAAELDRSTATVRHWLTKHGLETTAAARRRAGRAVPSGHRFVAVCVRHGRTRFVVRRDGTSACLRCRTAAVVERRRRVKQRLVDRAGGACVLCGYDRYAGALHFHHVDPATKRLALGGRGLTHSWRMLTDEAAKCALLCANCHAEVEGGVTRLPS